MGGRECGAHQARVGSGVLEGVDCRGYGPVRAAGPYVAGVDPDVAGLVLVDQRCGELLDEAAEAGGEVGEFTDAQYTSAGYCQPSPDAGLRGRPAVRWMALRMAWPAASNAAWGVSLSWIRVLWPSWSLTFGSFLLAARGGRVGCEKTGDRQLVRYLLHTRNQTMSRATMAMALASKIRVRYYR